MLAGKPWRRRGLIFIGIGAAFTGIVTLLGANAGSGLTIYTNSPSGGGAARGHKSASGVSGLSSLVSAPFRAPRRFFHDLWPNKLNVYANLAPAGGIGIFSAWGFGVPLIIILENNLRPAFSVTAAQNFPMYCFVSLGTVMVLAKIGPLATQSRHSRRRGSGTQHARLVHCLVPAHLEPVAPHVARGRRHHRQGHSVDPRVRSDHCIARRARRIVGS